MENWKAVVGYEGIYEVSDMGRVRALDRVDHSGHKRNGRILVLGSTPQGYAVVRLTKEGVQHSYSVHQVVMYAFVGVKNLTIDHRNTIRNDNTLSNLRYCTPRENQTFDNVRRKNPATSPYPGVGFHKSTGKWRARTFHEGKSIWIGVFDTPELASEAYTLTVKELTNEIR